ncbi:MAG: hypothetical protein V3S41_03875, partial [Spirochaetia bacterium]
SQLDGLEDAVTDTAAPEFVDDPENRDKAQQDAAVVEQPLDEASRAVSTAAEDTADTEAETPEPPSANNEQVEPEEEGPELDIF